VAVRNNLNKKMFADGHEGRTLQSDCIRLYFLSEAATLLCVLCGFARE
jgi:hypothetical protein